MNSIFDEASGTKVNMDMVLDVTNIKTQEEVARRSESRFRRIISEIASGMPQIELKRMFKNEMDENKKKEVLLIYQARLAQWVK